MTVATVTVEVVDPAGVMRDHRPLGGWDGGVEDWRVIFWGAHTFYRTSSFAEGARFVVELPSS